MFKGDRVGTPNFYADQQSITNTSGSFNDQPLPDNIDTGQCNVLNGNAILNGFGFYSMKWDPASPYSLDSAEAIRIMGAFTWELPQEQSANIIGVELFGSLRIIQPLQMPIIPIYGDLTGTPSTEFANVDIRNVIQIAEATPEIDANRSGLRHNHFRTQIIIDVTDNTTTQYHAFGWEIANYSGGAFDITAFHAAFGIRTLNNQFDVDYLDANRS